MSSQEEKLVGAERFTGIDKLIHEPARLLILAHLFVLENADFLFIRRQTGLTPGNLSSHLSKLELAGYINIQKEFVGKRPHTILGITEIGKTAFVRYRQELEEIIHSLPR
jgi:DNA-binding MarR family transcriptional regulator